jgi:hypothetical protein
MDQQEYRGTTVETPAAEYDRVISDAPTYGATTTTRTRAYVPTATYVDEHAHPRNRVQWGPVIAGAMVAIGVMIFMTVLGVAIGSSAFEPGTDLGDWGAGAGIWGGISALVAFFVGGWVAARSAAVWGDYSGAMNGFLAGMTTLVAIIAFAAFGADNALGFLGGTFDNIANFTTDEAAQADAFNVIEDGAWGTLIALVLALGAAALGGWLGHRERYEVANTDTP